MGRKISEVRWEVRKRIRGARRGILDERGGARLIMVGRVGTASRRYTVRKDALA